MKKFFISCAFTLTIYVLSSNAEIPRAVSRRIDEQEEIVNQLADRVVELFTERSRHLRSCLCSTHSCTNQVSEFECTSKLGYLHDVCGANCEGRQINFNSSAVRTPPNTNLEEMNAQLKESLCLYSNLEPLMKNLTSLRSPNWLYFGGVDGSFRIYPAAARPRRVKNGDETLNRCKQYDPRFRPWFIAASTRPKDIVFVIDTSGSMDDKMSESSSDKKIDATKAAMLSMLDTLASFDFVNVVEFSGIARRLATQSSLLQGTAENLNFLKDKVKELGPTGATDFSSAFEEAFDILTKACGESEESASCSECQKVIIFLTDGRDTSGADHEGIEPADMLSTVETYQQRLEDSGSQRASIFTVSMGASADDSIPRQIACANNGSWSFIGANTDPLTAMNSYYHFLTKVEGTTSPIWINPYEDDGGLGQLTTVAKPVYSEGTEDLDGVFLGVVGHDVLLTELEDSEVSHADVLSELTRRSQSCNQAPQSPCQLQVHRNVYADEAVCVDPILKFTNSTGKVERSGARFAHRFSRKYYKLFTAKVDWTTASQRCEQDGGRLATISNDEELAFVAGLSSPDGSWIGARRNESSSVMEWIDARISSRTLEHGSDWWGLGEPNNYMEREDCVHIDRRGPKGNLNDESCAHPLSYICEYTSVTDRVRVVEQPEQGYFSIPPLSQCVHEEESLANAGPLSGSNSLSQEDLICPMGEKRDTFNVTCCNGCKGPESDDKKLGLILGLTLPLSFALLLSLFVWWRCYNKKQPIQQQ